MSTRVRICGVLQGRKFVGVKGAVYAYDAIGIPRPSPAPGLAAWKHVRLLYNTAIRAGAIGTLVIVREPKGLRKTKSLFVAKCRELGVPSSRAGKTPFFKVRGVNPVPRQARLRTATDWLQQANQAMQVNVQQQQNTLGAALFGNTAIWNPPTR